MKSTAGSMNHLFALAAFLAALVGAFGAHAQVPLTLAGADGSQTTCTTAPQWVYSTAGLVLTNVQCNKDAVVMGDQLTYAGQVYPGQNAWQIKRFPGNNGMAVGAQINAWCYAGTTPCFAGATESANFSPIDGPNQIGWENAVINVNPASTGFKVGNNAVIKCKMDNDVGPCATPNNTNSHAYLITGDQHRGTGWENAFSFGYDAVHDSTVQKGTIFNLRWLRPDEDFVLFRFPDGREITISQFERAIGQ